MSPSPRAARRRASLQGSLLALVLVPVLGLGTVVGVVVHERVEAVRAADAAAAEVRAAAALDDVRGHVARELVPLVGAVVLADPSAPTGLDERVVRSRAATDTALAEATDLPPAEVARTRRALAAARDLAGRDVSAGPPAYTGLLSTLTAQIGVHLRTARSQGLHGPAADALGDLLRVSRAAGSGTLQVPLLLAASASPDPRRLSASATATGGFLQASADVVTLGSPGVVRAWTQVTSSDAGTTVDSAAAALLVPDGAPFDAQQNALVAAAGVRRDDAVRQVLTTTADTAVAAATAEADAAATDLHRLLWLVAVTVLVTLAATLRVRRWIAGPLRRLADQAAAVGAGDLVDVDEDGPDEVRTVAQGLAAAVSSLRRVREQARAVAEGDLDSPVVREPLTGALGEVVHASVTRMIDALQDRERLQADLVHQASHDHLTALPNRAQAQSLVDHALHRAARSDERIGVLVVDIDHFQAVNDTLGHAAGDELLRTVAARLSRTVRGADVVCRLGGDEFVVVVEPVDDEQGLLDLGRRLITAVGAPVDLAGRSLRVGASVGSP